VTIVSSRYAAARAYFADRGAGTFPHYNGSLLVHLEGTYALLEEWGNPEPLCLAGLCHTAYGTDGFRKTFFNVKNRAPLRELVGEEAESIIYLYGSCDRRYTYESIAHVPSSAIARFRDRFTGRAFCPSAPELRNFLELTFANELELTAHGRATCDRAGLRWLLGNCQPLVSAHAYATFLKLCGAPSAR
jgi:hypothetical protein